MYLTPRVRAWLSSDFFDFFFKSCVGERKGKILKKVARAQAGGVCTVNTVTVSSVSVSFHWVPRSLSVPSLSGEQVVLWRASCGDVRRSGRPRYRAVFTPL